MSLLVLFHFTKEKYMKDDEGNDHPHRKLSTWAGLVATGFIVMVNAGRLYDTFECKDNDSSTCKRIKYAVGLGAISAIVSLVWLIFSKCFKGRCGDIIQAILVWALLVFWVLGVVYLTFPDYTGSSDAPATGPGNVYFFTWGSFALCTSMAMTSVKNFFNRGGETEEAPKEQEKEAEKDEAAAAEEGGAGEESEKDDTKEVKSGEGEAEGKET